MEKRGSQDVIRNPNLVKCRGSVEMAVSGNSRSVDWQGFSRGCVQSSWTKQVRHEGTEIVHSTDGVYLHLRSPNYEP